MMHLKGAGTKQHYSRGVASGLQQLIREGLDSTPQVTVHLEGALEKEMEE